MTGLSPYQKFMFVGVLVVALLFTTIVVFAWVDENQKRRKLKLKRGRRRSCLAQAPNPQWKDRRKK